MTRGIVKEMYVLPIMIDLFLCAVAILLNSGRPLFIIKSR